MGNLPDSSLHSRVIGSADTTIVASHDYLDRRGVPRKPGDLERHDCILIKTDLDKPVWQFDGPGGPLRVPIHSRLRVNSVLLCREAAIAGLGIARLPALLCEDAVAAGTLRPVLGKWHGTAGKLQVVYPSNRYLAPKVRAFVDFLARPDVPAS